MGRFQTLVSYHHKRCTFVRGSLTYFHRALLWSFHSLPSRQEDAHTSSCRRSNYVHSWLTLRSSYECIRSGLLKSKDHACRVVNHRAPTQIRLAHRAQHATQSHSAQVSNPMTIHVL